MPYMLPLLTEKKGRARKAGEQASCFRHRDRAAAKERHDMRGDGSKPQKGCLDSCHGFRNLCSPRSAERTNEHAHKRRSHQAARLEQHNRRRGEQERVAMNTRSALTNFSSVKLLLHEVKLLTMALYITALKRKKNRHVCTTTHDREQGQRAGTQRAHSLGHELIVAPQLANTPRRNHRDAVSVSHGGQPVRHHQGSAALLRLEVVEGRLDLRSDSASVTVRRGYGGDGGYDEEGPTA